MRLLNDSTYSIIDYTGTFLIRINGSSNIISISPTSYQPTINYTLNTKGIVNTTNELINATRFQNDGLIRANNDICILTGGSLYITDSLLTKYLRNHHNGSDSYIDYTGGINYRSSGSTYTFSIHSTNYQGTFGYNLNTNGISNSSTNAITNIGTLSQVGNASYSGTANFSSITNNGAVELGPIGSTNFTYIDMKTYGNSTDYDVRFGTTGMSNTTSGKGKLTINLAGGVVLDGQLDCNAIISTGSITKTSNITCNTMNCTNINISDEINQTLHRKFRGYSDYINTNPAFTFSYVKYNGVTGTSSSESLTIQSSCRCVKVLYECDINEANEKTINDLWTIHL